MLPLVEALSAAPSVPPIHPFFVASLPLPPGINHSYRIIRTRQGRACLAGTPALVDFKELAAVSLLKADVDYSLVNAIRQAREKVPLDAVIRFYFSSLWKRDIDGGEKHVIDVIFKHLELNDNLIVQKHTTKQVDMTHPHVEVELRCMLSGK